MELISFIKSILSILYFNDIVDKMFQNFHHSEYFYGTTPF